MIFGFGSAYRAFSANFDSDRLRALRNGSEISRGFIYGPEIRVVAAEYY